MLNHLPKNLIIVAGMPRGGTTSLYHILDNHPGAYVPFRKETAYFSYNFHKGLTWYCGLYRGCPEETPAFDISPQYFLDMRSIERIKELAPDAKVILAIREPVEWVISGYLQTVKFERRQGLARYLESDQIKGERETIRYTLAGGFVQNAIERYRDAFGPQLLLYDFTLFRTDPVRVLQAIEDFVAMPRHIDASTYQSTRVNASNDYRWRWLGWLLTRERTITFLDTVLPRRALRHARLVFDRLMKSSSGAKTPEITDEERTIVRERMGQDSAWVAALLHDNPIQLGDGRAFPERDSQAVGARAI